MILAGREVREKMVTIRNLQARWLCLLSVFSIFLMLSASAAAESPYMGGDVETITLKSGARISDEYQRGHLGGYEPAITKVASGVWTIVGRSIVNVYVIEGKTGLIVYDTGFNEAEGRAILSDIRSFSDRRVEAVIYSHTHYPHGAAVLAEGREITVIGHPSVNRTASASGLGGSFPETMPVQIARTNQQMGFDLPSSGSDASVGHRFDDPWGKKAFLPVNRVPKDGETITLDGIEFQFFTENVADSESVTAWIPVSRIALSNFYWPVAANLYTPRGDKFRDAKSWIAGLKVLRDLKPALLLPTHTDPVAGVEEIQERLEKFIDYHAMIFDQSLRGIMKGLGPDDLREFVVPPPSLANIPQGYGETLSWYPPSLYNEAMGWFSGDSAELNPPPPDFVRQRTIVLMGGSETVLQEVERAETKGAWAWALYLVDMLHDAKPDDVSLRRHKARLLRKHAELTPSSISHNFYISQARELDGSARASIRVYPESFLQKTPICALIDQYRIRIVPERTEGLRGNLVFATEEGSCALIVRPGVAEFVGNVGKEFSSTLPLPVKRNEVIQLFRGQIDMTELVSSKYDLDRPQYEHLKQLAAAFEQMPGENSPQQSEN